MVDAATFHVEHLTRRLTEAAARLGAPLSGGAAAKLVGHLRLLAEWNRTHNLVGPGTIEDWLSRHTLDSLAAASLVPAGTGFDVGSGAGFPGIPIAVARPDVRMVLIEPRQKRAAFLQAAIGSLGIDRATVESRQSSAVAIAKRPVFVISRATFPVVEWIATGAALLGFGGQLVAFLPGGGWPEEKLVALGRAANLAPTARKDYEIPGQPARTVVLFVREDAPVG